MGQEGLIYHRVSWGCIGGQLDGFDSRQCTIGLPNLFASFIGEATKEMIAPQSPFNSSTKSGLEPRVVLGGPQEGPSNNSKG